MEMAQQILPLVKNGTNILSSNRRPVGSARKRQRARELASAQLSLPFDFDALESMTTLKPAVGKADPERVYSMPRLRIVPVYNDSVAPAVAGRIHNLDRAETQCCYPMWGDDERDFARHFMCGGAKTRAATYCQHHMALAYGRRAAA